MKSKFSKVMAVVMTLVLLLSLAACASKSVSTEEANAKAEDTSAVATETAAKESETVAKAKTEKEDTSDPGYLANDYFKVQNVSNGLYVASSTTTYFANTSEDKAMTFYMKPSDLGEYIFYDETGEYLAAKSGLVVHGVSVYDPIIWKLEAAGNGSFTIYNTTANKYLTQQAGYLVLTDKVYNSSYFTFTRTTGDNPFPEATTNVNITDAKGNEVPVSEAMARPAVGEQIIGYADTHAHLFHNLGSGEVVFSGSTYSPLGITDALKDCTDTHGEQGIWDIWGIAVDGDITHDDTGYPDFNDWPTAFSTTHNQTYYKWLERAYLSGERVMVAQMVNNSVLGEITNLLPPYKNGVTNDMEAAQKQIQAVYGLQDYVDAQCGGEGKGWFHICTTAKEARETIANGQMAVFLGIECDQIFDATEDVVGEYKNGEISESEMNKELDRIDASLQKYYDLGIRSFFPIHAMDNGFGGCQLYQGEIMNIENFLATGEFLEAEDATNVRVYFKELSFLGGQGDANTKGLTETGKWLIRKMIDYKYIIEIDHMSDRAFNDTLDICWEEKYPGMIASHTRILDMFTPSAEAWEQIDIPRMLKLYQLGGFISVMAIETDNGHQICVSDYLEKIIENSAKAKKAGKASYTSVFHKSDYESYGGPYTVPSTWYNINNDTSDDLVLGIGFATDVNGACNLPMLEDQTENNIYGYYDGIFDAVNYDDGSFTALHDGVYSSKVKNVTFDRQTTGNYTFDISADDRAVAHYGLMPDLIKMWESNPDIVNTEATFNAAEGYIRMLERVEKYSDTYPSRDSKYWVDLDDVNGVYDYYSNVK